MAIFLRQLLRCEANDLLWIARVRNSGAIWQSRSRAARDRNGKAKVDGLGCRWYVEWRQAVEAGSEVIVASVVCVFVPVEPPLVTLVRLVVVACVFVPVDPPLVWLVPAIVVSDEASDVVVLVPPGAPPPMV